MFKAWGSLPLAAAVSVARLVAFARGGSAERRGAAVYAVALLAVALTRLAVPTPAPEVELAFDGVLFAALFALTWKSARDWPVWTAILQAMAIAVDLAAVMRPQMSTHVRTSSLWAIGLAQASAFAWGNIPALRVFLSFTTLNVVNPTVWYRFLRQCWRSCIPRSGRRSTRWRRASR